MNNKFPNEKTTTNTLKGHVSKVHILPNASQNAFDYDYYSDMYNINSETSQYSSSDNNISKKYYSKTDKKQIIRTYIRQFIDILKEKWPFDNNVYYNDNNKRNDKFKAAINEYAHLSEDEIELVCYDSTVFGSATDGALLSTKGIYIHNYTETAQFIAYSDISNIELNSGFFSPSIKINNKLINLSGMQKDDRISFMEIIQACYKVFDPRVKDNFFESVNNKLEDDRNNKLSEYKKNVPHCTENFCKNCGYKINKENNFCPNCGAKLD